VSLALILYLLGLTFVVGLAYYLFGSFLFGAGYQPTPPEVAEAMVRAARLKPGDHLFDLGAGTGTLLFRVARYPGVRLTGIEVDPLRFLWLRFRRWRFGETGRLRLLRRNFFDVTLTDASVVFCFLWPSTMRRLREKFLRELPPGTRIVSYYHPIPGWTPYEEDRKLRVYAYRVPFGGDDGSFGRSGTSQGRGSTTEGAGRQTSLSRPERRQEIPQTTR
jgi:SAM-dependent methyltransferase